MSERARLIRKPLVDAEKFDSQLSRLFVELRRHCIVNAEASPTSSGIGMTVPFPGVDAVDLHLTIHLFPQRRPVGLVLDLVPVVIRRAVSLRQRALATREI